MSLHFLMVVRQRDLVHWFSRGDSDRWKCMAIRTPIWPGPDESDDERRPGLIDKQLGFKLNKTMMIVKWIEFSIRESGFRKRFPVCKEPVQPQFSFGIYDDGGVILRKVTHERTDKSDVEVSPGLIGDRFNTGIRTATAGSFVPGRIPGRRSPEKHFSGRQFVYGFYSCHRFQIHSGYPR
jgi:hypothetical protein